MQYNVSRPHYEAMLSVPPVQLDTYAGTRHSPGTEFGSNTKSRVDNG